MTSADAAGRLPTVTTCGRSFFIATTTTTTTTTTITTTTSSAVTACCRPIGGTIRSATSYVRASQGRARSASRTEGSADENRTGVPQTGSDRRTLPGVGTYLIDTPKDSGLLLRQRLLSFHEQHRGLGKSQNGTLPEIPFRLNPKPEPASPASIMNRAPSILKADVGTSPMLDEGTGDPNFQPSRTDSPALSSTGRTVTFATEPEVTAIRTKRVEADRPKPAPRNGVKRSSSREIDARALNKSANFTERTGKRNSSRSVRECTKLKLYSFSSEDIGKEQPSGHVTGAFPEFSDATRTHRMSYASKKNSSSLSDLTAVGVLFSLFDNDGDTATPRSLNSRSDKLELYSFSESKKSKSLLDLKSIQDCDLTDLSAYHKRQRIAHLAFRRDNSIRTARHGTLSIEEADKEWMEMANTAVVDNTEYDKFASRRKPMMSSNKKAATVGKSHNPKSATNFKIAQPSSGKVFPVFFNDGLPVRKFGHTMYRKKMTKSGKT